MASARHRTAAQLVAEQEFCLALSVQGVQYREMARLAAAKWPAQSFSHETCRQRVLGALHEAVADTAADRVLLEETRYNAYLDALQPKIDAGDVQAIDAALRVSKERRRLLGLDQPTKVEMSGEVVTPFDVKMRELTTMLGLMDDPTLAPVETPA